MMTYNIQLRAAASVLAIAVSTAASNPAAASPPPHGVAAMTGATPIQHVIIIFQENQSFDHYFGTYPGARGIPAGTCVPFDPANPKLGCMTPYHDQTDYSFGGPHQASDAQRDLDDGITQDKMDGFIRSSDLFQQTICGPHPNNPNCLGSSNSWTRHDVVGYHDDNEIPNYWEYAKHFVLQDMMFTGVRSWSTPSHVDMTSEWMALCSNPLVAATCQTVNGIFPPHPHKTKWPWVSLFELMDTHQVTWKYYRSNGSDPDCDDALLTCQPDHETGHSTEIWNPPAFFGWTTSKGAAYYAEHDPTSDQFLIDVKNGTLPQVSWIIPNGQVSEHSYGPGVTLGMDYVTSLVNATMQSQYWNSTAIFVVWDDWGGYYDHVAPPNIDYANPLVNTRPDAGVVQGWGLRVPGLLISPWAKAGLIDHQLLSFASYASLVEDLFMGGARLDPNAMGRPDNRPTIRDALTMAPFPDGSVKPIGRLINEFDFTQTPLKPLILNTHVPGGIQTFCRHSASDFSGSCQKPAVLITWVPLVGPKIPGPFTYHVQRDGVDVPQCTGTTAMCTDMPGTGTHFYRVYSVDNSGVASPKSAASEAIEP